MIGVLEAWTHGQKTKIGQIIDLAIMYKTVSINIYLSMHFRRLHKVLYIFDCSFEADIECA